MEKMSNTELILMSLKELLRSVPVTPGEARKRLELIDVLHETIKELEQERKSK